MIKIILNTKEQATFEKENREESWFNHDCSDENLLRILNRENDSIKKVQWEDGKYMASLLHVYFN
jgi:hypothetical protein